jgi:outer membrane protein OmpA-like peptidoglycan-associated protein
MSPFRHVRGGRPRRVAARLAALVVAGAASAPSIAHADLGFVIHAEGSAAKMLGAPKSDQFGFGGGGLVAPELLVTPRLGVELPLGLFALGKLDTLGAPLAPSKTGTAFTVLPGIRWRLLVEPGDRAASTLWIAGGAGLAATGTRARGAFDLRAGLDFKLGRVSLGPVLGYLQIIEASSTVVPEDARVLTFGVHGVLDFPKPAPPPPPPQVLDRDHDGIPDAVDKCPDQPETKNGLEDEDGCPEADRDGDGLLDPVDKCPDAPEDKDGFEDEDGCPDPDNDHDGIADVIDKCPNEPETVNGFQDDDGCPDVAPPKTREIHERLGSPVLFDFDKAELEPNQSAAIGAIAKSIAAHPEYVKVTIEGFADEVGSAAYNLKLSDRRAGAVKAALVQAGAPEAKLVTIARGRLGPEKSRGMPQNRKAEVSATSVREEPAPAAAAPAATPAAPAAPATKKPGGKP